MFRKSRTGSVVSPNADPNLNQSNSKSIPPLSGNPTESTPAGNTSNFTTMASQASRIYVKVNEKVEVLEIYQGCSPDDVRSILFWYGFAK
jgi:hypothetical protein